MTITNQNGFPQISAPFVDPKTGVMAQVWYFLLLSLWDRTGAAMGSASPPITPIVLTSSPFSYTADAPGNLWIEPGCYCKVTLTRAGDTLDYGYITRGIFPMSVNDKITVVYTTLPPSMSFI